MTAHSQQHTTKYKVQEMQSQHLEVSAHVLLSGGLKQQQGMRSINVCLLPLYYSVQVFVVHCMVMVHLTLS